MIKRENRLKKNKHFQFIYKKGNVKQTRFLTVVYLKTYIQPFKVGFSVTKKIGKSVVRNKVKRRLQECFNLLQNSIDKKYNYVFVVKPGIENLNFFEIKKEMENCIKKVNSNV